MADKHIHADVIIAWANGAEVQYFNEDSNKWRDTTAPQWMKHGVYRVKPAALMVKLGDKLMYDGRCVTVNAAPNMQFVLNYNDGSWCGSLKIEDATQSYPIEDFKKPYGGFLCATDFEKLT